MITSGSLKTRTKGNSLFYKKLGDRLAFFVYEAFQFASAAY